MNTFTRTVIIAAVLFVSACSKENMEIIDVYANPDVLIGKWKLSETLADPGDGSGQWKKVANDTNQYIEFKADGKFSGNIYVDYTTYAVRDSSIITFTKADGVTYQNERYKLQGGVLSLSPAGPIYCIEACGARFKKIE
jgi:hypothetical protein